MGQARVVEERRSFYHPGVHLRGVTDATFLCLLVLKGKMGVVVHTLLLKHLRMVSCVWDAHHILKPLRAELEKL